MLHTARAFRFAAFVFALALVTATAAAAQPAAARPAGPPQAPGTALAPVSDFDAERVREQFYEVLQRYPPSLGRVFKLDPSLMSNEAYLAPYAGVAAFLAQHPEVGRNPAYFLERIGGGEEFGFVRDAAAQKRREIQEMLAAFAAFLVFLVVTGVVIWVIRTIIDARRWNRVSKTQAEVHTKLLDRFSNNEDLLAYIQTPVGRRFLESGPAPMPDDGRPIGAPFSRILLSVQTGIVLTVSAVGMLYLSRRLDEEVSAFFLVTGVVALAVGVGFLVSSAAAFAISSRLGLLSRGDSGHA
jgi:hypothetical protein